MADFIHKYGMNMVNDELDNFYEKSMGIVDLLRRKETKMDIGVDKVIDYAERLIQGKGLDLHTLYPEELYQHCKNVAILSVSLGFLYRLNLQELLDLGVGSLLHDIGKIEIADPILKKSSVFELEKGFSIQDHPIVVFQRIQGFHFNRDVEHMVLQHHERIDGSGYPFGLFDIPLCVQMVAMTDVFDWMSSKCYRQKEQEMGETLDALYEMEGFDKRMIDILKDAFDDAIGGI